MDVDSWSYFYINSYVPIIFKIERYIEIRMMPTFPTIKKDAYIFKAMTCTRT